MSGPAPPEAPGPPDVPGPTPRLEDIPADTAGIALSVWGLAWPTMLAFGLQTAVGFVDLLIVSALGSEAVAAVGLAHQIYFAFFAVMASVVTGTVALVARFIGAGDPREADRVLRMSVVLAGALAAALMAIGLVAEPVIAAFGVEPAVVERGARYLRILLLFNVPFAVIMVVSMGIRGAGDVRTPLVVGAILNVVNVVLNYGLVYGRLGLPALGTDGSALGTGIAETLGAAIYLELWRRNALVVPRHGWIEGLGVARAWRILRIGLPTALEQGTWQLGLLLFLRVVAGFGTEPVSAYLIGVRILSLSFVPGLGFSQAGATLVGQLLGAREPDAAERAGWRSTLGAMAVMSSVGLTIILLAGPIARIFGATGERTVELTIVFIHILGAAQPLMAMEFALGGCLRGAGDTRFPLFAILTGLFAVRLGGAALLIGLFQAGVVAVWSCLLADYLTKATLLALRFRSGAWKRVEV